MLKLSFLCFAVINTMDVKTDVVLACSCCTP